MSKVIVFGPTGNIGSVAAKTAAEHGAKVYLAMRDTSKTIPGLDSAAEKSGSFERVQADLTKADTVAEAIKTSGAKRAFFYVAHGTPDHMKSSIQAMKDAGIDFVVLLSSFTVHIDHDQLRDVQPSEVIPFVHAKVEINLEDIYGEENFVAIRPGAFATNVLRYKQGIIKGEVSVHGNFKSDSVTPGDMGRVSGTVLANGPKNNQKKVYVYGPQRLPTHDTIKEVAKFLGKDIKIREMNADEALQQYLENSIPRPVADYMIRSTERFEKSTELPPEYETGVENVKLYTGQPAETFDHWVKENLGLFEA